MGRQRHRMRRFSKLSAQAVVRLIETKQLNRTEFWKPKLLNCRLMIQDRLMEMGITDRIQWSHNPKTNGFQPIIIPGFLSLIRTPTLLWSSLRKQKPKRYEHESTLQRKNDSLQDSA